MKRYVALVFTLFFTVSFVGWCVEVGYLEAMSIVTTASCFVFCVREYLDADRRLP